jgi:hypothetical protein
MMMRIMRMIPTTITSDSNESIRATLDLEMWFLIDKIDKIFIYASTVKFRGCLSNLNNGPDL